MFRRFTSRTIILPTIKQQKGQNSRPEFAILEMAHIVNLLHEGDRAILPQPRVRNEPPLSSQMQVPASRLDA